MIGFLAFDKLGLFFGFVMTVEAEDYNWGIFRFAQDDKLLEVFGLPPKLAMTVEGFGWLDL